MAEKKRPQRSNCGVKMRRKKGEEGLSPQTGQTVPSVQPRVDTWTPADSTHTHKPGHNQTHTHTHLCLRQHTLVGRLRRAAEGEWVQALSGMFVFVLLFFPLTLKVDAELQRPVCVCVCVCVRVCGRMCVRDCVRQRQKEHMAAAAKAVN